MPRLHKPEACLFFPVRFPGLFRLQPLLLGQQEITTVIPTSRNKVGRRWKSSRCLLLQGKQEGTKALNPRFLIERLCNVRVLKKAGLQFHMRVEFQNTEEKVTNYEKGRIQMKTICIVNYSITVLQNALSCTNWHIIKTRNNIKLPTLEA